MKEKTPCVTRSCVRFTWLISRPQVLNLRSRNQIRGIYFFLENYEGAVSHNVLYHQPLPITRHQERFLCQ